MKERPIIFSGESVREILASQKTQTRRIVKPKPGKQSKWLTPQIISLVPHGEMVSGGWQMHHPKAGQRHMGVDVELDSPLGWIPCPLGLAGDRLWVREKFRETGSAMQIDGVLRECDPDQLVYAADGDDSPHWRSPIHMPRWASRLTLEIVSVRVERLQDISEEDCFAEGIQRFEIPEEDIPIIGGAPLFIPVGPSDFIGCGTPRGAFERSWNHLHGKGAWETNPWVWRIEFRRVEP
jgi:hypothetical protein